jgi:cell division protein FtsA
MEMSKSTAALEITSDSAKLAVGYVLSGQPILLYYAKKPLKNCLNKGDIVDSKTVQDILHDFLNTEDESANLKLNVQTVSLILPPVGFTVYMSTKTTNVIASNGLIDKIDISNVMSLVRKDPLPKGSSVVDIVPDCFVLNDGKFYANPPLGEKSDYLTVQAKIHALPESTLYTYRTVVEQAGFRIKRCCVATYCASQLFAGDKAVPDNYIYIDFGAHLTTLSLIGRTSPVASLFLYAGGDNLSDAIASAFNIPFDDANRLKERYGYDLREPKFQTPLLKSKDEFGKVVSYYQKDLNKVIETYFEGFDSLLSNALATLIARQPFKDSLMGFPLVFGGGASRLLGLEKLLPHSIANRTIIKYVPHVLGARDPGAINLLGLIAADGSYKGTLEDDYHGVSTLSRSH